MFFFVDYHIFAEVVKYLNKYTYKDSLDLSIFKSITENISFINGYKPCNDKPICPVKCPGAAGAWAYFKHNIYPFIIELCDTIEVNYNPDMDEMLETYYNHLLVNLY